MPPGIGFRLNFEKRLIKLQNEAQYANFHLIDPAT